MSILRHELEVLSVPKLQILAGKNYFNIPKATTMKKQEVIRKIIDEMQIRKMWFIPRDPSQMNFSYTSMTDEELRKMLVARGVKYIPPANTGKENIIKLLSAESCDVENDQFCTGDKFCDVKNNICIDKGDTDSDQYIYLNGQHRIIGDADSIEKYYKSGDVVIMDDSSSSSPKGEMMHVSPAVAGGDEELSPSKRKVSESEDFPSKKIDQKNISSSDDDDELQRFTATEPRTEINFNSSDFQELKPTEERQPSDKTYIDDVRMCLGLI